MITYSELFDLDNFTPLAKRAVAAAERRIAVRQKREKENDMKRRKVDVEETVVTVPKSVAMSARRVKTALDEIPSATTLKAIEQADRGEWGRVKTYEEFLDRVERESPSLKVRIAKRRKKYERSKSRK